MGVSAGTYICQQLKDKKDAVVAEIAGIDSLPLTQDRSQGFKEALADCGLKVSNRVAAEFTVESGEKAAANLLQAAPKIDAIWNHDDDQGVGVMAAIKNSGRKEFFVVGGAGSANVMRDIKSGTRC
jgi:ribose transport system substrate-binding protein